MSKAVVVLSGGMDSTTLLWDVVKRGKYDEVLALSIDYGQRHCKELVCAEATCQKLGVSHKIVDMSIIGKELLSGSSLTSDIDVPEGHYEEESMKATVVPNRNMVLLSLSMGYAISQKAEAVYYGAHAGDHAIYPDCRKEFVEAMQVVAQLCDWSKLNLFAPYIDIDKGDIAIKGKELGTDFSLSWTCYNGREKACGKCSACVERLEAFVKAGIEDPIEYE